MKLADYLARPEVSRAAVARALGISEVSVSRYATGARFPRPEFLARIATATGGNVTPQDMLAGHDGGNSADPAKPPPAETGAAA